MPGKRGRPKKVKVPMEAQELGNPDFNISGIEVGYVDETEITAPMANKKVDFTEIDKKILGKKHEDIAPSAITPEMLEFEMQLQSMNAPVADISDRDIEQKLTEERADTDFLGDFVEGYKPASSPNEMDHQVFLAAQNNINSIEATEQMVRAYTKGSFNSVKEKGYFVYKNIRVFLAGKFSEHMNTDDVNMFYPVYKIKEEVKSE